MSRKYVSIDNFASHIFNYDARASKLVPHAAAKPENCPAGRVLTETGKQLLPGITPGILVRMVSVYDESTMIRGFINSSDGSLFQTYHPALLSIVKHGVAENKVKAEYAAEVERKKAEENVIVMNTLKRQSEEKLAFEKGEKVRLEAIKRHEIATMRKRQIDIRTEAEKKKAEEDAQKRRQAAEEKRKQQMEEAIAAQKKAEEETAARRKAVEEAAEAARLKAEEAARLKAEEAARLKAEEAARLKAEEAARLKAEEEARIKAEEEARIKAEEAARIKAEEEARIKAEEEARIKAEEEARIKAEEAARIKAEEEARMKAEEEARIKAEEAARIKAEEEARIKAEEEARIKAEEEARLKAEEEARLKAEEEARLKAEEEARVKAEKEARIKAEKEAARLKVEQEAARIKAEQQALLLQAEAEKKFPILSLTIDLPNEILNTYIEKHNNLVNTYTNILSGIKTDNVIKTKVKGSTATCTPYAFEDSIINIIHYSNFKVEASVVAESKVVQFLLTNYSGGLINVSFDNSEMIIENEYSIDIPGKADRTCIISCYSDGKNLIEYARSKPLATPKNTKF